MAALGPVVLIGRVGCERCPLTYGSFGLDPQIILGWVCLERNIKDAVELLLSHEHVPAISWIAPTSLGCTRYC